MRTNIPPQTMIRKLLSVIFMITLFCSDGKAWVYPEHRDIFLIAIQKLDSNHRAILQQLWTMARKGYENRLTTPVADATQNERPALLDYAAWPAIAGDHSTSAQDMLYNILHTDWILNVADIAARLKNGLAASTTKSERANKMRDADMRLLRADPGYVTRAGANNVHFLLARPDVNTTAAIYFEDCMKEGAEPNVIGTYKWFHMSALYKARRLSSEHSGPEQRSALALAALADEAFALHFLEDGFASGHVAGIWGNAALRKGTHDYYNENGLEVTTWKGERMVLTGDAYLRPADAERAAESVLMSLVQILDASVQPAALSPYNDQPVAFVPDTLDIANALKMPARPIDPAFRDLCYDILITTPVPGLATGLGEIPRFRSEIGPFIGIAPAARVSGISGGFGMDQKTMGMVPGLEIGVHLGLGMDGVMNESGDGLIFLDLGWRLDGASTTKIERDPAYNQFGSILSAIPSRDAFYGRIRMPYYVIPGDLIILGPLLLIVSPKSLNNVVATAGQGGLIPWQRVMRTSIGRFQFILGREVGICFYGSAQGADSFLVPDAAKGSGSLTLLSMHSTHIDFPFLEYRPMRTFSRRQSASIVIQLNAGMDIPGKVRMIDPPNADPKPLKTVWFFGVRLAFDWRYYYAKKKNT